MGIQDIGRKTTHHFRKTRLKSHLSADAKRELSKRSERLEKWPRRRPNYHDITRDLSRRSGTTRPTKRASMSGRVDTTTMKRPKLIGGQRREEGQTKSSAP